jgi:glycosyltransferase involved in cell wall biosynthesis
MVPAVSVLMSVHNGERFLVQAVESILTQTFHDFEFLIIDDASTDSSSDILKTYASQDTRIRIIKNQENLGLTQSLNLGLVEAQGPYIARMDDDDIAMPERLGKQVASLDANPAIWVVGSWMTCIDENGKETSDIYKFPEKSKEITRILRENSGGSLAHPAVMMRKDRILAHGGYRNIFKRSQDYDLWLRLADCGDVFANIPEKLLLHRIHADAISNKAYSDQVQCGLFAWYSAKCRERGISDFIEPLSVLPGISETADRIAADFPEGIPMMLQYAQSLGNTGKILLRYKKRSTKRSRLNEIFRKFFGCSLF